MDTVAENIQNMAVASGKGSIRIKNVSSIISSYPATLIFLYLFNKLPLKCLICEDKDRPSTYWTSVLQSCSFLRSPLYLAHAYSFHLCVIPLSAG
jgi:hypothetical protein